MLSSNGPSICQHAALREAAKVMGQRFGFLACVSLRNDIFAEANPQRLVSIDPATHQEQVHGPAFTDQTRQADSAAVDQGNAPAAAD